MATACPLMANSCATCHSVCSKPSLPEDKANKPFHSQKVNWIRSVTRAGFRNPYACAVKMEGMLKTQSSGYQAQYLGAFCGDRQLDFVQMQVLVVRFEGRRVGAQKVKLACMHFRQFYEAKSKQGCLMALALVRSELCDVRSKFQTMMQLE
ncbi:histidine-containing phosphotransfer protein 3 [Hordeum vulgare]|nr:histidine-containing phosphotransfer protein 3 [Hordeum vulgare]